jgi:hypothetical protein
MDFMLRLRMTAPNGWLQTGAIAAMILVIATTAQAAPKMAQRVAMQDQPLCFVQLPGKTTNLDKFCGLGNKSKTADRNSPINLDIDLNRDGISDQLVEAIQQQLDAGEAAQKEFQAKVARYPAGQSPDTLVIELNALNVKIRSVLDARLPYSSQVKQLLAEDARIVEQFNKLQPSQTKEAAALQARLNQISKKMNRDPSLAKVRAAMDKASDEIAQRRTAPYVYRTTPG